MRCSWQTWRIPICNELGETVCNSSLDLANFVNWLRSQFSPFVSRLSLLKETATPLLFWSCIFSTCIFSWVSPIGWEVFCILTKLPLPPSIPRKKSCNILDYHIKATCKTLQSFSHLPEPPILTLCCNCKDTQSHKSHSSNFSFYPEICKSCLMTINYSIIYIFFLSFIFACKPTVRHGANITTVKIDSL